MDYAQDDSFETPRPYRSHRIRACDSCRRRKIQCKVDLLGRSCHACHKQAIACSYNETYSEALSSIPMSQIRRQRSRSKRMNHKSREVERPEIDEVSLTREGALKPRLRRGSVDPSNVTEQDKREIESSPKLAANQGRHIVGPVMAREAQIMEQTMSPDEHSHSLLRPNPYNFYSDDANEPVLYMTIPKRRAGLQRTSLGANQLEILQNIFGGYARDVINLYLEKVNPYFPILEESMLRCLYAGKVQKIPAAIVCTVYASALIFWNQSSNLSHHCRPNMTYVWNVAVAAVGDDFTAPGMTTILAALIDLNGRPSLSLIGNATLLGRTIALAHSLGLNRNPKSWLKITESEKSERIIIWWAVLIHDRWASLAHGTPPHISETQYDVPIPTEDDLFRYGTPSATRFHGGQCFISLCRLTEILGRALPVVYNLRQKNLDESLRSIQQLQTEVDIWEDALPNQVAIGSPPSDNPVQLNNCNIKLSLLAVKMLICRIALYEISRSCKVTDRVLFEHYRDLACKQAQAVVLFVCELEKHHLEEFWLPYSAYHFASAITLLLRCSCEMNNTADADECIAAAQALIQRLQEAKEVNEWDLSDICLTQCEGVMNKIRQYGRNVLKAPNKRLNQNLEHDPSLYNFDLTLSNELEISDDIQELFPNLWDIIYE